ncbi:MAG TPA: restriction endonuclease [Pyrinomonadaceae bacterium]|nr:restriction endonuclease [Pyrinomonadaceae bacterium]
MAVPDFQSLMLPLLKLAAGGQQHPLSEAREALAGEFKLTQAERDELLPSGSQSKFANRVAWAKSYLQQAGLLLSPKRGHFQITARGQAVLKAPPGRIDIKFLEQYPEFVEFRTPKGEATDQAPPAGPPGTEADTPEEALEAAHLKMKASLASEVLGRVKSASSDFFERLVVELLLKMGYGGSRSDAGQAVGKSGDEGIDGIISEDRLGLDIVYLQAKKWDGTVGRPEIQKFVGALHGKRAKKGVFITTGRFSEDAVKYVESIDPKVILIDGRTLAELMIDYGLGTTSTAKYEIRRVDSDYFAEE